MSEPNTNDISGTIKLGMMLTQPHPSGHLLEQMKDQGYSFVIFDCEHGMFDLPSLNAAFTLCRALKLLAVVRIPNIEYPWVAPILDAGADVLMIPRVRDCEEVTKLLDMCMYPPHGQRGLATGRPHTHFRSSPPGMIPVPHERIMPSLWIQVETVPFMNQISELFRLHKSGEMNSFSFFRREGQQQPPITLFLGPSDMTLAIRTNSEANPLPKKQADDNGITREKRKWLKASLPEECHRIWWDLMTFKSESIALHLGGPGQASCFIRWYRDERESSIERMKTNTNEERKNVFQPEIDLKKIIYLSVGSDVTLMRDKLYEVADAVYC